MIGLERELRDKPAGFRTMLLVCVGACIFTIVAHRVGAHNGSQAQIAAQIVSGIGFLCAGAVLRAEKGVVGLTTAATIWAVAALGMAVGFGYLGLAMLGAFVILVTLILFPLVTRRINRYRHTQEYRILAPHGGDAPDRIADLFSKSQLEVVDQLFYQDGERIAFEVRAVGPKDNHERLRQLLIRSQEYQLGRLSRAPSSD